MADVPIVSATLHPKASGGPAIPVEHRYRRDVYSEEACRRAVERVEGLRLSSRYPRLGSLVDLMSVYLSCSRRAACLNWLQHRICSLSPGCSPSEPVALENRPGDLQRSFETVESFERSACVCSGLYKSAEVHSQLNRSKSTHLSHSWQVMVWYYPSRHLDQAPQPLYASSSPASPSSPPVSHLVHSSLVSGSQAGSHSKD